jgi:hypothetical protein
LSPQPFDIAFAHKLEAFAGRTASDVGIPAKDLPDDMSGRPVSALFEVDSVSEAPIPWFRNAYHAICPLDTAFCITKVHESLSVMAVLRSTARREGAAVTDFCEQMPGFDDIFEIWLSLVAVVREMHPLGVLRFIERYLALTGFTARIRVAVTYLEAALSQLAED